MKDLVESFKVMVAYLDLAQSKGSYTLKQSTELFTAIVTAEKELKNMLEQNQTVQQPSNELKELNKSVPQKQSLNTMPVIKE